MEENILEISNISKTYGGVEALNNVDIAIKEAEVHALVGENGQGKYRLN